jgi:AhpD family alkylhydroperoxidase
MIQRTNYPAVNPKATNGLGAVNAHVTSIDGKLRAMVELLVSQINGCVYCVDLHAEQARMNGERQQRIDCISVWLECPFFDDRERAAFAWAEAVTHLADTNAPDELFEGLRAHFNEQQIVDLTFIISLMNAWNRLAVSFRHMPNERPDDRD